MSGQETSSRRLLLCTIAHLWRFCSSSGRSSSGSAGTRARCSYASRSGAVVAACCKLAPVVLLVSVWSCAHACFTSGAVCVCRLQSAAAALPASRPLLAWPRVETRECVSRAAGSRPVGLTCPMLHAVACQVLRVLREPRGVLGQEWWCSAHVGDSHMPSLCVQWVGCHLGVGR